MKATGIVRRIDELGRVVIPKEIRTTLRLRDGDPIEIFTEHGGSIILRKYSPIGDISEFAAQFAASAYNVLGVSALVTDTDQVVAASDKTFSNHKEKHLSPEMREILDKQKSVLVSEGGDVFAITDYEPDPYNYSSQAVAPVVSHGETLGAVVLVSAKKTIGETELRAAEIGASFLAGQMYAD